MPISSQKINQKTRIIPCRWWNNMIEKYLWTGSSNIWQPENSLRHLPCGIEPRQLSPSRSFHHNLCGILSRTPRNVFQWQIQHNEVLFLWGPFTQSHGIFCEVWSLCFMIFCCCFVAVLLNLPESVATAPVWRKSGSSRLVVRKHDWKCQKNGQYDFNSRCFCSYQKLVLYGLVFGCFMMFLIFWRGQVVQNSAAIDATSNPSKLRASQTEVSGLCQYDPIWNIVICVDWGPEHTVHPTFESFECLCHVSRPNIGAPWDSDPARSHENGAVRLRECEILGGGFSLAVVLHAELVAELATSGSFGCDRCAPLATTLRKASIEFLSGMVGLIVSIITSRRWNGF